MQTNTSQEAAAHACYKFSNTIRGSIPQKAGTPSAERAIIFFVFNFNKTLFTQKENPHFFLAIETVLRESLYL